VRLLVQQRWPPQFAQSGTILNQRCKTGLQDIPNRSRKPVLQHVAKQDQKAVFRA
jgi:hypothetical protein